MAKTETPGDRRTIIERVHDAIVKARVEKGLELLKEKHGDDWVEKIDCASLDLATGAVCVVGQVYNSRTIDGKIDENDDDAYERGLRDLGLWHDTNSYGADALYGFNVGKATDEEMRTILGMSDTEISQYRDAFWMEEQSNSVGCYSFDALTQTWKERICPQPEVIVHNDPGDEMREV